MKKILCIVVFSLMVTGCGLGNIKKTTYLQPGMTADQVRVVLGNPSSSQFIENYVIWKYNLHQYWVGWVPHYLAFWSKDMTLVAWQANMNEYYANQQIWINSLPKQHIVTHQGGVDVEHSGTIYHEVR